MYLGAVACVYISEFPVGHAFLSMAEEKEEWWHAELLWDSNLGNITQH